MSAEAIRTPSGLTTDGLLGRRYVARFIDSILIGLLVVAMVAGLSAAVPGMALWMVLPLTMVVWIGYGTLFESSRWQATLGKRWMGLRVYNEQGGRLSPLQAAGRTAVKDMPFLILGAIPGMQLLSIGWLCAHVVVLHRSDVYQAIHDKVAHTWVAAPEATTQLHLT